VLLGWNVSSHASDVVKSALLRPFASNKVLAGLADRAQVIESVALDGVRAIIIFIFISVAAAGRLRTIFNTQI